MVAVKEAWRVALAFADFAIAPSDSGRQLLWWDPFQLGLAESLRLLSGTGPDHWKRRVQSKQTKHYEKPLVPGPFDVRQPALRAAGCRILQMRDALTCSTATVGSRGHQFSFPFFFYAFGASGDWSWAKRLLSN